MNVAVIPARGGSKRIPKKNIKPFFYIIGQTFIFLVSFFSFGGLLGYTLFVSNGTL